MCLSMYILTFFYVFMTADANVDFLPVVRAEIKTGPEWSDEEGPQEFWVMMNVLSGTWK